MVCDTESWIDGVIADRKCCSNQSGIHHQIATVSSHMTSHFYVGCDEDHFNSMVITTAISSDIPCNCKSLEV